MVSSKKHADCILEERLWQKWKPRSKTATASRHRKLLHPLSQDELTARCRKRTWRAKFKEWYVTRASQLQSLKASNVTINLDPYDEHEMYDETSVSPASGSTRRSSAEPIESAATSPSEESRSPLLKTTSVAPGAIRRGHNGMLAPEDAVSTIWGHRSRFHKLETVYSRLQAATGGAEVFGILQELTFDSGQDSVLHLAATKADTWTLDYILDHIRTRGLRPDLVDSQNSTPLELAMKAGHMPAVERLLFAGASLQLRNHSEQTPLHFAIQEGVSAEICELLLNYGANSNSPLNSRKPNSIPLNLVLDRLSQGQRRTERDRLCAVFDVLLRHGAQFAIDDHQEADKRMRLLRIWLSWDASKLLIHATDLYKHCRSLLRALLSPCHARVEARRGMSLPELVDELLQRMAAQKALNRPEPMILQRIMGTIPESERLCLVEIALQYDIVSEREWKELLQTGGQTSHDAFWKIAECVLTRKASSSLWKELMEHHFGSGMFRRNRPRSNDYDPDRAILQKALGKLGMDVQLPQHQGEHVMQCLVHYLTKELLQGNGFGTPLSDQQRVSGAIQLRQEYHLPPLSVPSDLIKAMSPHLFKNRGEAPRSAPGYGDLAQASQVHLESQMTYATPQSLSNEHC